MVSFMKTHENFLHSVLSPWILMLRIAGCYPALQHHRYQGFPFLVAKFSLAAWTMVVFLLLLATVLIDIINLDVKYGSKPAEIVELIARASAVLATPCAVLSLIRNMAEIDRQVSKYQVIIGKYLERHNRIGIVVVAALLSTILLAWHCWQHKTVSDIIISRFKTHLQNLFGHTIDIANCKLVAYVMYTASVSATAGHTIAQYLIIIICTTLGCSFDRLNKRLTLSPAAEFEDSKASESIGMYLKDHEKLSQVIMTIDGCISGLLLIYYSNDFLWLLYSMQQFKEIFRQRIPVFWLVNIGMILFYTTIRTISFVFLNERVSWDHEQNAECKRSSFFTWQQPWTYVHETP